MASGIYVIENVVNDTVYLGQAVDIEKRWRQHVISLNNEKHFNRNLQSDWLKYGEAAFKFSVVEYCAVETLTEREQHHLDTHSSTGYCYNIKHNAASSLNPSRPVRFDRLHSTEKLLALLNEHKTVAAVANIIGMSEANLFRNLQRRGFKKIVTHVWSKRS